MISKISALEDSEKNRSLIEGIESKLLDVQSKLRALHDEKNKTTAASLSSSAPPSVTAQGSSGGFRGRGRGGRFAFDASRGGRGGGRARGNRGGNMSLDTRPKSLLISNAPEGFDKQAAAHFGRYLVTYEVIFFS